MDRCLNPNCSNGSPLIRGLCKACYKNASHSVNDGLTTWEELEKHKKSLPVKPKNSISANKWLLDFKNTDETKRD